MPLLCTTQWPIIKAPWRTAKQFTGIDPNKFKEDTLNEPDGTKPVDEHSLDRVSVIILLVEEMRSRYEIQ